MLTKVGHSEVPSVDDVAELRQILTRMKAAKDAQVISHAALKPREARVGAAAAPTPTGTGGSGLGSTLGDLGTLLNGLTDTLEGVCNVRQDIINLTNQFGL